VRNEYLLGKSANFAPLFVTKSSLSSETYSMALAGLDWGRSSSGHYKYTKGGIEGRQEGLGVEGKKGNSNKRYRGGRAGGFSVSGK